MLAFVVGILSVALSLPTWAQVNATYTFSQSNGTYTPITGGTVLLAQSPTFISDVLYPSQPIGFSFVFNGTAYTSVGVSDNGYIWFGTGSPLLANYAPLTNPLNNLGGTGVIDGSVAILGRNLNARNASAPLGEIQTKTIGIAPNRVFVIQYASFYGNGLGTSVQYNAQIQLNEVDNSISLAYGTFSMAGGSSSAINTINFEVGVRGIASNDIHMRSITTSWAASAKSTNNTQRATLKPTVFPASGLTFTFTPPAPSLLDVGVNNVFVLPGANCYGANQTVVARLKNYGTKTIVFDTHPVTVGAVATGQNPLTFPNVVVATDSLAPLATRNVTLSTTYNMNTSGGYNFKGFSTCTGDGNVLNDTTPLIALAANIVAPASFPLSVNFSGYNGSNLGSVAGGWSEAAGATAPAGTTSSWTSGNFGNVTGALSGTAARINLSNTSHKEWLLAPKVVIGGCTHLEFDLALTKLLSIQPDSFGTDDKFQVLISTDCGASYQVVKTWDKTTMPHISNTGQHEVIDLSVYNGLPAIIAFFATDGTVNDALSYDIFVDNIYLNDYPLVDVAAERVTAANYNSCFSTPQTAKVRIRNRSCGSIDFSVTPATIKVLSVGPSGSQIVTTTVTSGTLAIGATQDVTLSGLDYTGGGVYTLRGIATGQGDGKTSNDTTAIAFVNSLRPSVSYGSSPSSLCAGSPTNLSANAVVAPGPNPNDMRSFASTINATGVGIPDNSQIGIKNSIVVSGYPATAKARDMIARICIDSLTHPNSADLRFAIITPLSDSVVLLGPTGVSGGQSFMHTCFSVNGASLLSTQGAASAPFVNTYLPDGDLKATAAPMNGGWKLHVKDVSAGSLGLLFKWHIETFGPDSIATYTWTSNVGGFTSSLASPPPTSPTQTTIYTLAVADKTGCTTTLFDTVKVSNIVIANTVLTTPLCFGQLGGVAIANATGGIAPYTYNWGNGVFIDSLTNKGAGTYTVNVTDGFNCTRSASVVITQPAVLAVAGVATTPALCYGSSNGTATVTMMGGTAPYSFHWNTGNGSNFAAGSYAVTVTDAHGCFANTSAVITQPATLNALATTTSPTCFGQMNGAAHVMPSGGIAPYTYQWTGGSTADSLTNVAAGNYSVTVMDANGCMKTVATTVVATAAVVAQIAVHSAKCAGQNNGSIALHATGGNAPYSYMWAGVTSTADSVAQLVAGTYSATITDSRGCTGTSSGTITNPTAIAGTFVRTNIACIGTGLGTLTINISGGVAPYVYSWSNNGLNNTNTANNLLAGNYSVYVTDKNGCGSVFRDTIVAAGTPLGATTVVKNQTLNTPLNGSVHIFPSGGVAPLTYLWTNGKTTQNLDSLAAGTYTVTITDHNGCTTTASGVVAKIVGTDDLNSVFANVALFPNPTAGSFTLHLETANTADVTAEIYTVTGIRVAQQTANHIQTRDFAFDLQGVADGVYFLRLRSGEATQVLRVVLQKN